MKQRLIIISLIVLLSSFQSEAKEKLQCGDIFYSHSFFKILKKQGEQKQTFSMAKGSATKERDISNFDIEAVKSGNRALKVVGEKGIEAYIDIALQGGAPDKFNLLGNEVTLLDIAIGAQASKESIEKLLDYHYQITAFGLGRILTTYRDNNRVIEILNRLDSTYKTIELESDGKFYSIGSFLLLNRKTDLLIELLERKVLDSGTEFNKHNLADINYLEISNRAKLGKFVDFSNYANSYKQQQQKDIIEQNSLIEFVNEYSTQYLTRLCVNDYNNIKSDTVIFSYTDSFVKELMNKNELSFEMPMNEINKKVDSLIMIDHIAALALHNKLSKFKIERIKSFAENMTYQKDGIVYVNKRGLTLQEQLFIDGEIKWSNTDPRFRLSRIPSLIKSNDSAQLREQIKKSKELYNAFYLGKNLTHYATLHLKDSDLLDWLYKTFGEPKVIYGTNTKDRLYISYFQNYKAKDQIKDFELKFPKVKASKEVIDIFNRHSKQSLPKNL
jgi:hypothetical protein